MRKIDLLLPVLFLLLSCNNGELEKEIIQLKRQNDILQKQTADSLSIYRSLKENKDQQFAEKFVDSLRKSNPKLLEKIEKEISGSTWALDIPPYE